MSMAAGEYVSVSSQADSERSDLARERRELAEDPEAEHRELAAIYVGRGLDPRLASEVAKQLAAKDALAAHARDELGLTEAQRARPTQAALASAAAFATGAALPLATALLAPAALVHAGRRRALPRVPRRARRPRGACRRRERRKGRASRHLLERDCHGDHGGDRPRLRRRDLRVSRWPHTRWTTRSGIR